jgi:hypothetical protein
VVCQRFMTKIGAALAAITDMRLATVSKPWIPLHELSAFAVAPSCHSRKRSR